MVLSLLLFVALYKLQEQIDAEHDSAPNLVVRVSSPLRTNVGADFYHLNIANVPKGIFARQTAEKVAGTVEICAEDGQPLRPPRVHRWAASPQIPGLPQVADLQLPIDIDPNGVEHRLDIVLKFDGDSDFYTHNNESVAKYGFKDPEYRFGPGPYIANIRIQGKNAAARFSCRIVNSGANSKLSITLI